MEEERKYFIYKVSGGLAHMLYQINRLIHLSKITKRFLIVDCLHGETFCSDFNKYFNIPNFEYTTSYDCLYQDSSLDHKLFESYVKAIAMYIDVNTYFLNDKLVTINVNDAIKSDEKIIYCSWIKDIEILGNIPWYIRVNKDVVDKISINKIYDKYIGVHYRNTDMKHELKDFISKIESLSQYSNIIYLATDDYTAFDRLNELLKDKFKIIQYTKPMEGQIRSVHVSNPNKDEVILNALIDMYNLTYSTYFIPSERSGFSIKIIELRKNDDFFNMTGDMDHE